MSKRFLARLIKNKNALVGVCIVLVFTLTGILAPWLAPHDPTHIYSDSLSLPPIWNVQGQSLFLLGTDDLGRDILSRLIYGARLSILIGLSVVLLSLSMGTTLGLLAGQFGGKIDWAIMRGVDILMTLPSILLVIVMVAILGRGTSQTIIAVALVSLPSFTRITRSVALVEIRKEYVEAARAFGTHWIRIMLREILPNCGPALIVQASFGLSEGILSAAALGFLGLGVPPPLPEWGIMLSDARPYIESQSSMVTLPGLCILLLVLGFNLLGDGLRDILDPQLQK